MEPAGPERRPIMRQLFRKKCKEFDNKCWIFHGTLLNHTGPTCLLNRWPTPQSSLLTHTGIFLYLTAKNSCSFDFYNIRSRYGAIRSSHHWCVLPRAQKIARFGEKTARLATTKTVSRDLLSTASLGNSTCWKRPTDSGWWQSTTRHPLQQPHNRLLALA